MFSFVYSLVANCLGSIKDKSYTKPNFNKRQKQH